MPVRSRRTGDAAAPATIALPVRAAVARVDNGLTAADNRTHSDVRGCVQCADPCRASLAAVRGAAFRARQAPLRVSQAGVRAGARPGPHGKRTRGFVPVRAKRVFARTPGRGPVAYPRA